MIHFVVAFVLLAHAWFWGSGLAMFAMPRPWRRFWPAIVVPAGFALQSLVVWLGAWVGLRGTNSYAWASEAIPLTLLVAALRRRGAGAAWVELQRFAVVVAASVGCLVLLVAPFAWVAKGLTTLSLASCDAADYAGGARVLMEFAHGDRGGFLGLTEVVRTMSVDNFFDYWLRLNHFTPSALIALNGTILGCAPHELTGLMTCVLLASSLLPVFWVARAVTGYSSGASLWVALAYGLSPLLWYAVGHVAMGQLLAAQAIGLLTWAGVALWRRQVSWQFSGVLAIGYALVLGSYNFILVVALVPVGVYAGGLAWWDQRWRRLGKWAIAMLVPLGITGTVFFDRVAGLVEWFRLFRTFDFGWRIPALTPEGWLGLVSGPELEAWNFWGVRTLLSVLVLVGLGWAYRRAVREQRSSAWVAASLGGAVLACYLYLEKRSAHAGDNGSYNAYKLFTVFYPLTLPAVCWWLTLRRSRRVGEWLLVAGGATLMLAGNLVADAMIGWRLGQTPFVVDGELRQLRKIETMTDVKSVNVLLPDMWSRLWANAFLLRKPQYFLTDTYEARWHTPLRGDWDLESGLVSVVPPGGARRPVTGRYALVDTRSPQFARASLETGWYPEEQGARGGEAWRWTSGDATVRIENPHAYPLRVVVVVDGWGLGERDLAVVAPDGSATATRHLGGQRTKTRFEPVVVPPGGGNFVLHSVQPATVPPGDVRSMAVCVFGVEIDVLE